METYTRRHHIQLHPGIIAWTEFQIKKTAWTIKHNWHEAWLNQVFRRTLMITLAVLPLILMVTNQFFNYIQDYKGGVVLNDWVLKELPSKNVSLPISFFMASVTFLVVIRCISHPKMFIMTLISFSLLLIARIISISATRLMAPAGLVELKDPICNLMYGSRCITRDLFFSGHTATLCILYLCSFKKTDRYYILFALMCVPILLLIQHVHYTVDVVCAPFFAFGCFWIARKIVGLQKLDKKARSHKA